MSGSLPERNRKLEDELFRIGMVSVAVGTLAGAVYYFMLRDLLPEIPCFFSTYIGIYCPGCGGTRAFAALLRGRFLEAVWYHPLVPYGAVTGGGFLLTQGLHRLGLRFIRPWKYHDWYLYGAAAILGCNFLIKNLLRLLLGIMM